ncbi:MAG TPA: alpha/beta hydrolase [Ktedonobacterales bacterium]
MSTVTSSDGTVIGYTRSGEGPALIVIGGALQHRAMFPQPAGGATETPTRFTTYMYDRRGRGESGDTQPYAVEREIDDIAALIDAAGGSAFVFGHSSGAMLALEAAKSGLPISKLVLYEPPFIIDGSRAPVPADAVRHVNDLIAAGHRGDAVTYFMTDVVGAPGVVVEQMRPTPMWPLLEGIAHTTAYDLTLMAPCMTGEPTALQRYTTVSVPTLILDGGLSPRWQHNATRLLAQTLPHAQHRTLEGQAHGAPLEMLMPIFEEFFLA